MVAILTRIFGIEHLNLAEDVVQEALARLVADQQPVGRAEVIRLFGRGAAAVLLDRRDQLLLFTLGSVPDNASTDPYHGSSILRLMDRDGAAPDEAIFSEDEISDDRLRLMFVCCHPAIPAEAQVALALKTLCGFSVGEIGHAFLTTDSAIA